MEKHISKFKKLFSEGLRGKIFKLCLIIIADAVFLFVVLDMFQLQLLWRTAQDNSDSQAKIIKEQSLDSLEKSTEINLTQTAIQAADNTDWELNMLRQDAVIIADQTEKILKEPWRYPEYDVYPPKKENGGKYTLQLLRSEDASVSNEDMELVHKLAGLGPMMDEMIADNNNHTQDMGISLPNGITLLMDDCSDQKIDGNGNEVYFDAKTRPWWNGAVETEKIYYAPVNFSVTNNTAEFEIGIPIYIEGELAAVVETAMELDTDGVPEATDTDSELFGTERMVQALNEKDDAAPDELLTHVKKRVDEFVGDAPQFDDLTMLGIKWLGTTRDPGTEDV